MWHQLVGQFLCAKHNGFRMERSNKKNQFSIDTKRMMLEHFEQFGTICVHVQYSCSVQQNEKTTITSFQCWRARVRYQCGYSKTSIVSGNPWNVLEFTYREASGQQFELKLMKSSMEKKNCVDT